MNESLPKMGKKISEIEVASLTNNYSQDVLNYQAQVLSQEISMDHEKDANKLPSEPVNFVCSLVSDLDKHFGTHVDELNNDDLFEELEGCPKNSVILEEPDLNTNPQNG